MNTTAIIYGFEKLCDSGQFEQLKELWEGESGGHDWRNLSPAIVILITVHLAPHLPELREPCACYFEDRLDPGRTDPTSDYEWARAEKLMREWREE